MGTVLSTELGANSSKRSHLTGMRLLFIVHQIQMLVQKVFVSKLRFYNQIIFWRLIKLFICDFKLGGSMNINVVSGQNWVSSISS